MLWANFDSLDKGKGRIFVRRIPEFHSNLFDTFYIKVKITHFRTLRLTYGECFDFSFVIISYLLSPAGGISPERTVYNKNTVYTP